MYIHHPQIPEQYKSETCIMYLFKTLLIIFSILCLFTFQIFNISFAIYGLMFACGGYRKNY